MLREFLALSLFVLVALGLLYGRLFAGVTWPLDAHIGYRWATQFTQALHEGVLYPRWMPGAYGGLGGPAFLYYPPLFYYLAAAVDALIGNMWLSIKLVHLCTVTATGYVVYRLGRRLGLKNWSILVAIAVQASPMFLFVGTYMNALAWYASVPAAAALLYASLLMPTDRLRLSIPVAVSVALLTLTHILSAFMMLLCLPFLYLAQFGLRRENRLALLGTLSAWGGSALLGVALAALYVVPALTTMSLINTQGWEAPGGWLWYDRFALPVVGEILHGAWWALPRWIIPGVTLAFVLVASAWLWTRRGARGPAWSYIGALTAMSWAALFFSTEISFPLWYLSDVLRKVQFPFRFIYVASLSSVLAVGLILAESCRDHRAVIPRAVAGLLIAGSLGLAALMSLQMTNDGIDERQIESRVPKFFGSKEYRLSGPGEQWRAYINNGAMAGECSRLKLSCQDVLKTSHRREWQVSGENLARLRLPLFAFPAWRLEVNGEIATYERDEDTGLITVRLPAGNHRIDLQWIGLVQETVGFAMSAVVLLVLLAVAAQRAIGSRRSTA